MRFFLQSNDKKITVVYAPTYKDIQTSSYVRILSFLFSLNNLLSTKTWITPTVTRTMQLVKDHHSTLELLLSAVCL